MNKEILLPDVDLRESILKGALLSRNKKMEIFIFTKDLKKITVMFLNLLKIKFKPGGNVSGLFEKHESSSYFQEAIKYTFVNNPILHGYKHYQLKDMDDKPIIDLVSDSILVFMDN